jgi:hypothetical protein
MGGLTLQNIKDNIAVWAVCAIVGLANYQLARLNDSVNEMSNKITTLYEITKNHQFRIDEHSLDIKAIEEKNGLQDVEIGKIQVRLEQLR